MIHRTGWTKSDRVGQVLWQFCDRDAQLPVIRIAVTVLRYGYYFLHKNVFLWRGEKKSVWPVNLCALRFVLISDAGNSLERLRTENLKS